jgi:hypothetical protein
MELEQSVTELETDLVWCEGLFMCVAAGGGIEELHEHEQTI